VTVAGKVTEEATLKKPQAKWMGWSNGSSILSWIILANFPHSMEQQKPWWFCVVYTSDGVHKSRLSHLFGYDDAETLRILNADGLVQYTTSCSKGLFSSNLLGNPSSLSSS
jgi:hypothetical protein